MNNRGLEEGIVEFQKRTGCTFLIMPKPDVVCGNIYVNSPKDEANIHQIGTLNDSLKPKKGDQKFDIKKILKNFNEPSLKTAIQDVRKLSINAGFSAKVSGVLNRIRGKYENYEIEQLIYSFSDNQMTQAPLDRLNIEMSNFDLSDILRYDFDNNQYFVVIETHQSQKFSLCTYKADQKNLAMVLDMAKQFNISAENIKHFGNMSCVGDPNMPASLSTYGFKFGQIKSDLYIDIISQNQASDGTRLIGDHELDTQRKIIDLINITKTDFGENVPYMIIED